MNEVYEVYEPAGLVERLVPGAVVRIRNFLECPFWRHEIWEGIPFNHTWCHNEKLVRRQGVVLGTQWPGPNGHRFVVKFSGRGRRKRGGGFGHYAAYELEPVEVVEVGE